METQDNKPETQDTGHLAQVVKPKKTRKKLYVTLAVVVVVFALVVGGLFAYKAYEDSKENSDSDNASQVEKDDKANMSEEERAIVESAEALTDAIDQETASTEKEDYTEVIQNSTAAATSVGKDIKEDELQDELEN